jgi:hypothetical protein
VCSTPSSSSIDTAVCNHLTTALQADRR